MFVLNLEGFIFLTIHIKYIFSTQTMFIIIASDLNDTPHPPTHLNCLKCHLHYLTSFYQITDEFDWKVAALTTQENMGLIHILTKASYIYIHITIFCSFCLISEQFCDPFLGHDPPVENHLFKL